MTLTIGFRTIQMGTKWLLSLLSKRRPRRKVCIDKREKTRLKSSCMFIESESAGTSADGRQTDLRKWKDDSGTAGVKRGEMRSLSPSLVVAADSTVVPNIPRTIPLLLTASYSEACLPNRCCSGLVPPPCVVPCRRQPRSGSTRTLELFAKALPANRWDC